MTFPFSQPKIQRITITSANTEKAVSCGQCRRVRIQAEASSCELRLAFTTGVVASKSGNFWTIRPADPAFQVEVADFRGKVYLATVTGLSNEVVNVLSWT